MDNSFSDHFLAHLSVDCVLFGFHQNELRVLLMKLKGIDLYSLPGGFVSKEADIDDQANSVLAHRTGINDIFLRQFYVFGDRHRVADDHVDNLVRDGVIKDAYAAWFSQRFVTIGYYGLVEYSMVSTAQPDETSDLCDWFPISQLPELMIDHRQIIDRAYMTLKREISYQPIGMNLLPEEFTMPELQALYETILDQRLDRRNFRRKMLSYNILIDTGKKRSGVRHKAPIIYRFHEENYDRYLQDGFASGWS